MRKPQKESEPSHQEDLQRPSYEDTTSSRTNTQLWDNVMGRMGGDPEVLKRLLANDSLVVTR